MLWICTLLDLLRAYPEYYESIQWLDFIQAFQFLRVVKLVNLLMRNDLGCAIQGGVSSFND